MRHRPVPGVRVIRALLKKCAPKKHANSAGIAAPQSGCSQRSASAAPLMDSTMTTCDRCGPAAGGSIRAAALDPNPMTELTSLICRKVTRKSSRRKLGIRAPLITSLFGRHSMPSIDIRAVR